MTRPHTASSHGPIALRVPPQDKLFYVSPFIEMAMRYHFRVLPPGERVQLRILETDREGPLLAATFNGRYRTLNTKELLRAFFAVPLVTMKIMAAIQPTLLSS